MLRNLTPWTPSGSTGADVVLLDGGFATELERRGHDLSDDLWSARLLLDDPDEIVATHLAFFRAGAQVATTASYQASVRRVRLAAVCRRDEAAALMRAAVTLAREAAESLPRPRTASARLVAASVGPYGAVLADGSEYTGDYGVTDDRAPGLPPPSGSRCWRLPAPTCWRSRRCPSEQEAAVLLDVLVELPVGDAGVAVA